MSRTEINSPLHLIVSSSRALALLCGIIALCSCGSPKDDSTKALSLGTNQTLFPSTPESAHRGIDLPPSPNPDDNLLRQAMSDDGQGLTASALRKVNQLINDSPGNIYAYNVRGKIHTDMNELDEARKDYEIVLQLDDNNVPARFNLCELKFMQKEYSDARSGFALLQEDLSWGDLASYKVFLCDLFNGDELSARIELDKFNERGRGASYYFANVAWCASHKQTVEAKDWLKHATTIYNPEKVSLYSTSLERLGYLPLPP